MSEAIQPTVQSPAARGKDAPLRCAIDVRNIPASSFGKAASGRTQKLVLQTIALYANADGSEAFPSLKKLGDACGLSIRGLSKVLAKLIAGNWLTVEYKASRHGTNKYHVRLGTPECHVEQQDVELSKSDVELSEADMELSAARRGTPEFHRPSVVDRPSDRHVNRPAWLGWAEHEFEKHEAARSCKSLSLSDKDVEAIEKITDGRTLGVFQRAFAGWLNRYDGFDEDVPAEVLLEELGWYLNDAERSTVVYDD